VGVEAVMSIGRVQPFIPRMRQACNQSGTWLEAEHRIRKAIEPAELALVRTTIHECLTFALYELWPARERDLRAVYLGFQFI